MNGPDPQRSALELQIFEQALDLPAARRGEFLDAACGSDDVLRAGVEALLAADAEEDSRTGGWRVGVQDGDASRAAPLPREFGGFELLETLGRGGMGVVHLARQRSTGREVALKVIRPELLDEPRSRSRFQREVQAASGLDHPNICTVYEAGEHDGVPYVAMRYVPGPTLAELLDVDASPGLTEREAGTSAAGVGTTTRDGRHATTLLFEKLAEALHAAHESGVLHRDVKPANIIVGRDGEPVLLDFGLARPEEVEDGQLTATAAQLGTPAYMSPEQIQAHGTPLDRRTDIYSLGVTMYEALAGKHPFAAPTREQLYQRVLAGRAPDLDKLGRHIGRDLAIVVQTAMDRDPDRRYETAHTFAEDLRRVRRHEPITARRPSPAARLLRWCRREPVVASLLAVLLVITGVAIRFALVADEARVEQAAQAEQARREAATSRRVTDFLVGLFRIADGSEYRGETITAREVLDQGFRRITEELVDEPVIKARLMATMGEVYQYLSQFDRAESLFEQSLDLRREVGATPRELALSLRNLGELHHYREDYESAEKLYRESLELLQSTDPGDDLELARTLDLIGRVKRQTGALEESARLHEEAFAMRSRLPADPLALADSHQSKALLAIWNDDLEAAMREFRLAIDHRREVLGDDSGLLPELLNGLAVTQQMKGDLDAARSTVLDALERTREIYGDQHHGVGRCLSLLGTLSADLDDVESADRYYREACEVLRTVYGEKNRELATQLHNLGTLKLENGELDLAEGLLDEALQMRREVLPRVHYDTGVSLFALGALQAQRDAPEAAIEHYRSAYAILVEVLSEDHPLPGMAAGRIADLLEAADSPEAATWRERAR